MISIIIPVYNAAPYLAECLDSIIAQTHTDWEVWAINDHSTDQSPTILAEYAQSHPRIHTLTNEGKGIIPALRLAYAHTNGQYITRMDADDIMLPRKLEVLLSLAQKEDKIVATGGVEYFSETTLGDGYRRYAQWLNTLTAASDNYSEIYKECVIPSPAWMVSRKNLDAANAFHPNTYPEDYDLVFRFRQLGLKVKGTKEIIHRWRDHGERSSRNDPNYANAQYFELKLPWFLSTDYDSSRPLVIWGAGKKGKVVAKYFHKHNIPFHWVCDTPSKWGHQVYGTIYTSPDALSTLTNAQVIVLVANVEQQAEVVEVLEQQGKQKGEDYYLFC